MKKIIMSCGVLISIGLSAQIPTTGLIGHWPFTGNADDATTNNSDGTVNNGAALGNDRFGNANSAYYFDGTNDFISIPHHSSFYDNTLSVCFWFKATGDLKVTGGGDADLMGLLSKSSSTVGGAKFRQFDFNIRGVSGALTPPFDFYLQTSNTANNNQTNITDNSSIVLDKWYFIVGVIDHANASLSLYVNGTSVSTNTAAVDPFINTAAITVGRFWDLHAQRYLEGAMDDIRIYDHPLSECDILNLYLENYPLGDLFPIGAGARYANPSSPDHGIKGSSSETENVLVIKTKIKDKEVIKTNTMKIYPNPAQDRVFFDYGNIDLLSGYKIKIVDSFGNSVYESNIKSATESIDVKSLGGAGTFFIKLVSPDNVVEVRKLVIMN